MAEKLNGLLTIDWREHLNKPFEDIRKELNIKDFPVWEDL